MKLGPKEWPSKGPTPFQSGLFGPNKSHDRAQRSAFPLLARVTMPCAVSMPTFLSFQPHIFLALLLLHFMSQSPSPFRFSLFLLGKFPSSPLLFPPKINPSPLFNMRTQALGSFMLARITHFLQNKTMAPLQGFPHHARLNMYTYKTLSSVHSRLLLSILMQNFYKETKYFHLHF